MIKLFNILREIKTSAPFKVEVGKYYILPRNEYEKIIKCIKFEDGKYYFIYKDDEKDKSPLSSYSTKNTIQQMFLKKEILPYNG